MSLTVDVDSPKERADVEVLGESTPLLGGKAVDSSTTECTTASSLAQKSVWEFLEAKTAAGWCYEKFMIALILVNVLAFILGTVFADIDADAPDVSLLCDDVCDAIWFGNYDDNPLQILGLGRTSVLELVTIIVFTIEYIMRVWTCPLENPKYSGILGHAKFIFTNFFSVVDLASTLPFYIDVLFFSGDAVGTTAFLRMFRLFRMMRVENGKYDSALSLCIDVYRSQKAILGTAAFVGVTTWISISSLYYLVERRNLDMIYCDGAPSGYCDGGQDGIDTSLCTIDSWGIVDCTEAGCPPSDEVPEPCWNLYQSIPMASYYSLLNLFGEFPLFDQHSVGGQIVGTITAVIAVT